MITQDNFNQEYADPIEEQQIRHFVCIEWGDRYIDTSKPCTAANNRCYALKSI